MKRNKHTPEKDSVARQAQSVLVETNSQLKLEEAGLRLIPNQSLESLLTRGLTHHKEFERWQAEFHDGQLITLSHTGQAEQLLKNNPVWARQFLNRSGQGEQNLDQVLQDYKKGDSRLIEKLISPAMGLPLRSEEQIEKRLSQLLQDKQLEEVEQGMFQTPAAPESRILLQGRGANGGLREILVIASQLTVVDLNNPTPVQLASLKALQEWIAKQFDLRRVPQAKPAPSRLGLPPLGGIGEINSWQAYIPGSSSPADQADISQHPPSDWLTGGAAAMCVEKPGEKPGQDALRSAAQLICIGSMVHSGYQAQPRRLSHEMPPLHLYRPANPYGNPPIPMGD